MNKRSLSLVVLLLFTIIFLTSCTKTETKTEKVRIPYETVEQADNTLWEGEEKTVQQGESGEKEITYKLIYRNGSDNEPDREDMDEKITKKPKDEIIKTGLKARATGKKFKLYFDQSSLWDPDAQDAALEYELTKAERKSYWNPRNGTGSSNGDFLILTFRARNLSEKSSSYYYFFPLYHPETSIYKYGSFRSENESVELATPLAGDDETEVVMVYNLNAENESVDPEKRRQQIIKGPEGLELVINEDRDRIKLNDLWVGPFYEN